jgi:predicted HAD superfamily phosphohydrolase YqeG
LYVADLWHIGIKTIIFDMDETLIHKIDASDKCQQADIYVEIPTEDNSKTVKVGI